jgi:hypothetical protein
MSRGRPRYSEAEARAAIASSTTLTEALRRLGMRPAGGNHATLRKYIQKWRIPTDHLVGSGGGAPPPRREPTPLAEVLVAGSTYSRVSLKRRLFAEGLKQRLCEICGQGEVWRGRRMALILDHVNGVHDDNRFENLRILCPNCAATLDTHCGRKNRQPQVERQCAHCGRRFWPKYQKHRYCSRACGVLWDRRTRLTGVPQPHRRKVERPPYEQLLREIERSSYLAVGRRYGVSDNAIRKWVRQYERERERRRNGGVRYR